MKLRYRQKLIWDNLVSHLGRNISVCILMILCFVLIGMSVLYYENFRYCKRSAERVLKYGVGQTECISFGTITPEVYPFLEEVGSSELIHGIGAWKYGGTNSSWVEELRQIQGDHRAALPYDLTSAYLEMYYVNYMSLPLFDFKLREGIPYDKLEMEENVFWLYLGSAYRDIEVGTEYRQKINESTELIYKVAGILQKNQMVPIPDLEERISGDTVTASRNMDYGIICVDNMFGLPTNFGVYSFAKGKQREAEELIKETAEKYQIVYEITPLEDVFAREEKENSEFIYLISRIAVIIMVISIILINSQHIVNFMERRREYGILYAQGFGRSDLLSIIVGETIVVFFVVLVISMLIMQGMCNSFWDEINPAYMAAKRILLVYVYPVFCLLAVSNGIVSTGVIYHVIKTRTPVELMGKVT